MKLSVLLENSYLVLIFSALLLIGNANLWDYKLSHEFPYGYLASDAFQHQARAEAIKDAGNFRFEANYISHGFENAVGRYPPIIYHLAVIFSYLTKLEVYDSIYFIVFFIASLSAIIMYFVIKGLNKNVALLSLPLSLLIFSSPNYIGFTWGHWPSMLGQFFLIALFWSFYRMEMEKSFLLVGIFLSAIILTHTSELIFGLFFIFVFFMVGLLFKRIDLKDGKNLAFGIILALIISFYYLIIFRYSWFIEKPYSFAVKPLWEGNPGFYLANFQLLLVFILIGIVFSLAKIKYMHIAFLAGVGMLIMGYGNYFGFDVRAFQLRFLWPIYLSAFFGFGIYSILKFFIKKWNLIYSVSLGIVFLVIFSGLIKIPFIPGYQKLTTQGVMDSFHWEALKWLSEKTPENSRLYFFYGDIYNQDALLRNSKRVHFQVDPNDFIENINNRRISREYVTELPGDGGGGIVYRKSPFSFGEYQKENEQGYFFGKKDICEFDYYVFDKASRQQALAQYNLLIANELLKNNFTSVAFENHVLVILKNNNVGADCIEERSF